MYEVAEIIFRMKNAVRGRAEDALGCESADITRNAGIRDGTAVPDHTAQSVTALCLDDGVAVRASGEAGPDTDHDGRIGDFRAEVFLRDLRYFPLEQRIGELKKIIRTRVRSAAALLKERYAAAAEKEISRMLSVLPDTPARQRKIREMYALRDQRHREIDERAGEYLKKYRDKFPLPDLAGLYRAFLESCCPEEHAEMFPEDGTFRQEDLPALAMICRAVYGLKTKPVKHIVIDECQDFSPFMIELLKQANPAATFTLVGDLYQGIRSDEGIRSWKEWQDPVFQGRSAMAQLTVSYRNTVEIMNLAQSVAGKYPIADVRETKPVLRHGEAPRILRADSERKRLALIRDQARAWQQAGFHSIALIEKTAEQARKLFRILGKELDARLLSETDSEQGRYHDCSGRHCQGHGI